MAEIPAEIIEIINKFIKESEKYEVRYTKVYLFGSYATGKQHKYSDIDLAVVSPNFEGIRFYDNLKISRPKLNISYDIETHPFRPQDFTEESPFVKEILENGIRIL